MISSKADPNLIIFLGTHEISWKTENCGGDIVALNTGRAIDEI